MIFRLSIDRDCQEEIIAKVHERTPLVNEIERLVTLENYTDQVPGFLDDEIAMLALHDIEYFAVEDEKTYAVYKDGMRYVIRKRLYEIEKILPGDFVRISKSAIANQKKIVRFKVQLSGAVDAVFESGAAECISRRCFAELKKKFGL